MQSLFYRANMHYDEADYPQAILDATLSHKIAINLSSPLWIAMSAEKLADISTQTINRLDAIKYGDEAAHNYLLAGKITNHRYALCDLAGAYGNNRDFDKCLQLLDSIINVALMETPVDTALLTYCCRVAVDFAQWKDDMGMAARFQNYAEKYCKIDTLSSDYFCRMAEFCIYNNNDDGVNRNLERALELVNSDAGRAEVFSKYIKYYKKYGMPERAIEFYDSVLNIQDRVLAERFKQSEIKAQRDYYDRMADEEAEHARRTRAWLVVVLCGACALAIFGYVVYRMRIRMKNAELASAVAEMELLRADVERRIEMKNEEIDARRNDIALLHKHLEGAQSRTAEMARRLQEVFHDGWSALDVLSREFEELPESDRSRRAMIGRIQAELQKMRHGDNIAKIVEIVDDINGGILGRIKDQCGWMDDKAVEFIALLLTGMSMRSVALLSGMKYRSAYTRRSRLMEQIMNSGVADGDALLAML